MLEILKKTERIIKAANNDIVIQNINKIDDEKKFAESLNSMNEKEKKELEESIIVLACKDNKTKEEEKFLDKYNTYCVNLIKKDIKNFINNNYLNFYIRIKISEYQNNETDNISLLGTNIIDITEKLDGEYNKLIEKMNKNDLNDEEKEYIKNFFSICTDVLSIEKNKDNNTIQDVVDFFEKYPIDSLSITNNKKMYILYTLSKELIKYNNNSIIKFKNFDADYIREEGHYQKINDNTGLITVNRVSDIFLNNEKEFLSTVFVLYHELGHFKQDFANDNYTLKEKEIFEKEKEIINKDKEFYQKYHDYFLIEKDADKYAIEMLKKYFKDDKVEMFIYEKERDMNNLNQEEFINIFEKEYNEIIKSNNRKTR